METAKLQGEALTLLRTGGLPDETALELCEIDKTLILSDVKQTKSIESSNQKAIEKLY